MLAGAMHRLHGRIGKQLKTWRLHNVTQVHVALLPTTDRPQTAPGSLLKIPCMTKGHYPQEEKRIMDRNIQAFIVAARHYLFGIALAGRKPGAAR